MKPAFAPFTLFLLLSFLSVAQTKAPKANPKTAVADPCEQERKEARLEGIKIGGELQLLPSATHLSAEVKPLPIALAVEDFEGASSFKLAAAEVIQTHFSDYLQVSPEGVLVLRVYGSNPKEYGGSRSQLLSVGIVAPIRHRFRAGDERHLVIGTFTFAERTFFVQDYSVERTRQLVREEMYDVLSEFLKGWGQASNRSSSPRG